MDAVPRADACVDPSLQPLVTPFCFGELSQEQRLVVERHLLECPGCLREVEHLSSGLRILRGDRSLSQLLVSPEVVGELGMAGALGRPFGGHGRHVAVAVGLYALLYGVAVVVEFAYQWQVFSGRALVMAIGATIWVALSSLAALGVDWKRASSGLAPNRSAWLLVASALVLHASLYVWLPGVPITEATFQTQTARSAFLKVTIYFIALGLGFIAVPYQAILALQRELMLKRHRLVFEVLARKAEAVAPRGVWIIHPWVLGVFMAGFGLYSLGGTFYLYDHLRYTSWTDLFLTTHLSRVTLWFVVAGLGLGWYVRMLNELRRECRLMLGLATSARSTPTP